MLFNIFSNTADKKAAYGIFVGFNKSDLNQDLEDFPKTIILF